MSTDNSDSNPESGPHDEHDPEKEELHPSGDEGVDDPDFDVDALTTGEHPVIEKEAIEDAAVLESLMAGGVDADEPTGDAPESTPTEQVDEDVDAIIAAARSAASAEGDESSSDVDSIIAAARSEEDDAATPDEPAAVDELDIDSLLLGASSDSPSEVESSEEESTEVEDSTVAPETSETDNDNSEDIDSFLLGASDDASNEPEDRLIAREDDAEPEEVESEAAEVEEETPQDIDSLLLGDSVESIEPEADDGVIGVGDLDDLLSGASVEESPVETEESPVAQETDEPPVEEAITEDDAAPGELVDTGHTEVSDAPEVSEEDLDALLMGSSEADELDSIPDADQLESLIEEELKTLSSEDEESLLKAGDSQDILDSVGMEDRLDTGAEAPMPAALPNTAPETADANMAVVTEEPVDVPETAAPEEVSEETLQEVGGENIVAAADTASPEAEESAAYTIDEDLEDIAPPVSDADDYVRPDFKRRQWVDELAKVPPVVVQMVKDEPYRAITGMAAGLIAMITAFLLMSASEYRPVSDYAAVVLDEGSHLRRAMTAAEIMIEDGEYAEAAATVGNALQDANPRSPLYLDAEYVQLEAEIKALGSMARARVANELHGKIDRMVTESPLHPKRPEALFWKGQLYEKEGNPQAARVEYRELLRNESQADNLHRVLLALGELELSTNRPVQAADYLQELRRTYPGTVEAARGRLLLGDALIAAGDPESARVTFISVAENDPGGLLGAEAFSRLGELAYESGNYDQAIRELEGRLSRSSSVAGNDGVTLLLAKTYRAVGRYEDAKNLLQGLIDFFPESDVTPLARVELSKVLNDMGLGREAVRHATQTAQLYPDNQDVLRNAGELLALHGDALDAGRAMVAAHAAGTGEPELLLSAGRLFNEAGAKERAERVFRQLSEDYARSRQGLLGHIELSKLLFEKGDVTEALERLENLADSTNSSSRKLPVLAALGELYGEMGLTTKVAEIYAEAASLSDEPEVLAESVTALFQTGSVDEGLMMAQNVDVQQLEPVAAYDFLNALGQATMRKDAREGLGFLEQAHASYPDARTAEGVQQLLEANLSLSRSARARAILTELNNRIAQREFAFERPRLEQAAITYGNFLFDRGDYRAASDAYSMALDAQIVGTTEDIPDMTLSERQLWSLFQLANTKFKLSEFGESIPLYERVAGSSSEWAQEASTRLESARLEQRLRGRARTEARNAG